MMRAKPLALAAALALGAAPDGHAQGAAFDGNRVGQGTLAANRGRGTDCGPETINRRPTVQGGVVSFNSSPRDGVRFEGPVRADGSFDLVNGRAKVLRPLRRQAAG